MDIQEHSSTEKLKSSRPEVFYKKAVLKIFVLITGKRPWWGHILIKVSG